jgi:hypothetical protein
MLLHDTAPTHPGVSAGGWASLQNAHGSGNTENSMCAIKSTFWRRWVMRRTCLAGESCSSIYMKVYGRPTCRPAGPDIWATGRLC